jgi:acyl-CoA thioester hydrolase
MAEHGIVGVEVCRGHVLPEWIDFNGHMNVAYYILAFDRGIDSLWERFGIVFEEVQKTKSSTFSVETHVMYRRELTESDPYLVTAQILAYDEKRVHQFQRMYHAEQGFLAATAEWMSLHVDLATRRVAPWPEPVLALIAEAADAQGDAAVPADAGRRMRVENALYRLGEGGR